MKIISRLFAAASLLGLASTGALAQSNCSYIVTGAVLTAAQWNSCFAAKQNTIPYTTVNKAGDTMLGRLTMTPSTTSAAGFNLAPGVAPTSPNNGDMWMTTTAVFARINGATVALTASGSGSFAATSPLSVTFPASVVTYALTGIVPIANGGTNGATAAAARTNLDVPGLNTGNTFGNVQTISTSAGSPATQLIIRSGFSTSTAIIDLGRTATEFQVGVAANASDLFTGSTAGTAILKSGTGAMWLGGATATPGIKIASAGTINFAQYTGGALQTDGSGNVTAARLQLGNLVQGTALSLLGVAGNVTADYAPIAAGSDFQVMRRSGTAIAFGSIDISNSAVVGSTRLQYGNLTQGSGLSVLGVTGSSTADVASIVAASDLQVMRRSGSTVGFGSIDISSSTVVGATRLQFGNLTQIGARSVLGVTGNSTADVAGIQGTANQVFVINSAGTALVFGQVNLAAAAAVTGTLPTTLGGTGLATYAQGDLIYGSASNVLSALAKDTNATRYLSNTGSSNNPAWAQINLANGVTGVLSFANIQTAAAFSLIGNTTGSTASIGAFTVGGLTNKVAPATTDILLLQDQAASGALKYCTLAQCIAAVSSGVTSIASNTGAFTLSNGITNSTNDIRLATIATGKMLANTTGSTAVPAATDIPKLNYQTFTASGTFTTPAASTTATTYTFRCVAGGGGGGGVGGSGAVSAAGGGGAGAYQEWSFSGVAASVGITVTIGTGGAAGSTSGGSGGNGNTTQVSGTGMTTVTLTGGNGAFGTNSAATGVNGGTGGTVTAGSAGDSRTGNVGTAGLATGATNARGGDGAGSGFGVGGAPGVNGVIGGGAASNNAGSGGGGAVGSGNAGGAGTDGKCNVSYVL